MAVLTFSGGKQDPRTLVNSAYKLLSGLKVLAIGLRAQVTAGQVSSSDAFVFMRQSNNILNTLGEFQSVPGVVEIAKEDANNALYDLGTEWAAFKTQLLDILNWFETVFPTSPSGAIQVFEFTGDGKASTQAIILTQTGQLGAKLDSLIATID